MAQLNAFFNLGLPPHSITFYCSLCQITTLIASAVNLILRNPNCLSGMPPFISAIGSYLLLYITLSNNLSMVLTWHVWAGVTQWFTCLSVHLPVCQPHVLFSEIVASIGIKFGREIGTVNRQTYGESNCCKLKLRSIPLKKESKIIFYRIYVAIKWKVWISPFQHWYWMQTGGMRG